MILRLADAIAERLFFGPATCLGVAALQVSSIYYPLIHDRSTTREYPIDTCTREERSPAMSSTIGR
jgi:hypothetical protein